MDKQTAKQLLILVNDKRAMDALDTYVLARIEILRNYLETNVNSMDISKIQGQIAELRRFKTLRDEVLRAAEDK